MKNRIKSKKLIRNAHVLSILINNSNNGDFISQKDIVTTIYEEEGSNEAEKKNINLWVSKSLTMLEMADVIVKTPLKIPGKRGPAQNMISLNKTPDALFLILTLQSGHEYTTNLINSSYYKEMVTLYLVKDFCSQYHFYFTEDDLKMIYEIVKISPRALKTLFYHELDVKRDSQQKLNNQLDEDEEFRKYHSQRFIFKFIQLKFIEELLDPFKKGYPYDKAVKIDIKVDFEDDNLPKISNSICKEPKYDYDPNKLGLR